MTSEIARESARHKYFLSAKALWSKTRDYRPAVSSSIISHPHACNTLHQATGYQLKASVDPLLIKD